MKMRLGNARETPRGAKNYFFLGDKKMLGKRQRRMGVAKNNKGCQTTSKRHKTTHVKCSHMRLGRYQDQ
jgi:hypothetical protein